MSLLEGGRQTRTGLLEILRGLSPNPQTGDQNLGTYVDQVHAIEDGGADIGTTLTDTTTSPSTIDYIVVRIYGGMPDDPGLNFGHTNLTVSWHPLGGGDGSLAWDDIAFPVQWWETGPLLLAPNGQPWTRAMLDGMDLSFIAIWEPQTPFPGTNVTWRVAEHEVEVWGTQYL